MTRTGSLRALNRLGAGIDANTITDALTTTGAVDEFINLTTLRWCMPVVRPSPSHEQALLEIVGNNSQFIDVAFLNKRTNSIAVPAATTFTWPLATASGVEHPRYQIKSKSKSFNSDSKVHKLKLLRKLIYLILYICILSHMTIIM